MSHKCEIVKGEISVADIKLLKKFMDEKKVTMHDLADGIGVDRATLYRKLAKEGSTFSIAEANKIRNYLNLSSADATRIFFKK